MEETAAQVEQGLVTSKQRRRALEAQQRAQAREALREPRYNIETILQEEPTAGAAKIWFLVRWEGYQPSWETWRIMGEVGTPLHTWEPLANVRHTEAYLSWQAAKVAARQAQA